VPADHDVAHPPACYRALSYRFAVECTDERLGRRVADVLAALRERGVGCDEDPAPTRVQRYTLRQDVPGAVDVWRGDEVLARRQRSGDALGWVVRDVNRSAAEVSGHHLLFHAAALDADGTGILVPGASGAGKSTLAAALTRAGFRYLTDELAALDLGSGRLLPYPKPITVKQGSFGVLADMDPGPEWEGEEWQVTVGGTTGRLVGPACAPGLIVLPRYDAAAPTALTSRSDTEAFFSLALNAVNLLPHGAAGTAALGTLVARSECVTLTYSDLAAACDLVRWLAAAPARSANAVVAAAAMGAGGHG
jgi:hypothetical protein